MSSLVLIEDAGHSRFKPLSLLRPVFELRCGHFSVRERIQQLAPASKLALLTREALTAVTREEFPHHSVNDPATLTASDTLFVNGRWLCDAESWRQVQTLPVNTWAVNGGDWVAFRGTWPELAASSISPVAITAFIKAQLPRAAQVTVGGHVLQYPWELIEQNPRQLEADFQLRTPIDSLTLTDPRIAILGDPQRVQIDPTASLDPFVVLDARHGSIWIEPGAKVQAFTRLEGPCFIGRETQLFRANVREGCSIGPVCRVGGEIEESILHGYANKYHDGFLGHAYICPWVNLGANTINSDLKNDYSTVKIWVDRAMLDSGSTKVGCFIGDHTKTALASLFNTGSSVGVMCLVLPGGELLPKVIPSFTRIWHGQLDELPAGVEPGIASARIAMSRRKQTLTPAAEQLLRETFAETALERLETIERQRHK